MRSNTVRIAWLVDAVVPQVCSMPDLKSQSTNRHMASTPSPPPAVRDLVDRNADLAYSGAGADCAVSRQERLDLTEETSVNFDSQVDPAVSELVPMRKLSAQLPFVRMVGEVALLCQPRASGDQRQILARHADPRTTEHYDRARPATTVTASGSSPPTSPGLSVAVPGSHECVLQRRTRRTLLGGRRDQLGPRCHRLHPLPRRPVPRRRRHRARLDTGGHGR